jgi:cytochrome d ubiquinol oxidase subunit I
VGAVLIPLQILAGDLHGLNTCSTSRRRSRRWKASGRPNAARRCCCSPCPTKATRSNHFEIGVPGLASLILKHDADGEIRGLNEFKGDKDEHPPVAPLFYGFRIMVGTGLLMLAFSWVGLWLYRRRGWVAAALPRPLLWGLAGMSFSGWVATLAGWYVTEIGRQPFIVFGLLRVPTRWPQPCRRR